MASLSTWFGARSSTYLGTDEAAEKSSGYWYGRSAIHAHNSDRISDITTVNSKSEIFVAFAITF